MVYVFGDYEVEIKDLDDMMYIADIFRDSYTGIVGTTDEELADNLIVNGFDVKKLDEE